VLSTVAAAAARLTILLHFDLLVDEALYAWIGTHNPFTLAPHPPGVPLLARAMITMFGRHEWAVRLPSFLAMAALPWMTFLLMCRMGAGQVAWWVVIILNAVPLYVGLGAVITPDAPQIFMWSLLLLSAYEALLRGGASRWALVGLVLGIGLAFKYILVLFVPSLLLAMLLVREWRRHWVSAGPYLAGLITVLILAALVALAGVDSSLEALRYHLRERQHWEGIDPRNIGIYELAHVVYISPILYVLALFAVVRCGVRGWRQQDRNLLFAFCFSVVVLGFFTVVAALTGRRLTREHWDAPGYVAAFVGLVLLLQDHGRRMRIWVASGAALGAFITLIVVIECLTGRVSMLAGARPPFTSFRGWRALCSHIDEQALQTGARTLLTRNFQMLVQYGFYGRQLGQVYTLSDKMDEKWGLAGEWKRNRVRLQDMPVKAGDNLLFVREQFFRNGQQLANKLENEDTWAAPLAKAFVQTSETRSLTLFDNGKPFAHFRLYDCKGITDKAPLLDPP
jgi:hypothetical protein